MRRSQVPRTTNHCVQVVLPQNGSKHTGKGAGPDPEVLECKIYMLFIMLLLWNICNDILYAVHSGGREPVSERGHLHLSQSKLGQPEAKHIGVLKTEQVLTADAVQNVCIFYT